MKRYSRFVIAPPEDEITRFLDRVSFRINGFGYFLQQSDKSVGSFRLDDLEWIYVTAGASRVVCDGVEANLLPGDFYLLEPGKEYAAYCTGNEPLFYYYIHFQVSPSALEEDYVRMIFGSRKERRVRSDDVEACREMFSRLLMDRVHGETGTGAMIRYWLGMISVKLMRKHAVTESDGDRRVHTRMDGAVVVNKAQEMIAAQLSSTISIHDICRELGVSESYLYKAFRANLSLSPSQYILQERLQRARYLIVEKRMSVVDAAAGAGFSSAGYLSRQCKQIYGISPSQWREGTEQNGGEDKNV